MNTTITQKLVGEVQKAIDGNYAVRIFDSENGLFVGSQVASAYKDSSVGYVTIEGELFSDSDFDADWTLEDYLKETMINFEQEARQAEDRKHEDMYN